MGQNINENTNWQELFSLYRSLVAPFQEFEKRVHNKKTIERGASNARGTIDYGYRGIIGEAFSHTIKGAIPFLIIFYIILNVVHTNGIKIYYYFDLLVLYLFDCIPSPEASGEKTLIFMLIWLILILVELFILYVLFPCFAFLFPLMIVGSVISRTHVIAKAKKTLKDCEELLPKADAAVRESYKNIAPYFEKIPKDYRNSDALAFLSSSFFNYKARNLQEAINLYDQYLHQQRMEQGQREMAMAQQDAMNDISRQLDYMEDLINSQEIVVNNYYYH